MLTVFYPLPGAAAYGASKAFVNSLSEALDYELRDAGVRVTAVCPGFTRTRAQRRLGLKVERVPRPASSLANASPIPSEAPVTSALSQLFPLFEPFIASPILEMLSTSLGRVSSAVPRTRQAISRHEKVGEIVAAAERRLREGGYESLSVAAIARELGIAQNAIYWYFPSKDHLFVAALEGMLRDIAARKPTRDVDELERILWFTDQFQALSDLRGAMNERARSSEVVADFVKELEELLSRMLSNALSGHVPEADLPVAVEAFRATVEGTFLKGLDAPSRRRVLSFALERLMIR